MSNHKKSPAPSSEIKRENTENFISRYANYSYIETSLWDAKIHFGQIDQARGNTVPINTAITLPWPQAKILAYFLRIHLEGYEAANGRIKIPTGIIPQADEGPFRKIFDEFIKANPESAPAAEK